MNDLTNSVAILGRPYVLTRSRLGAITKLFRQRYVCDLVALKEIFYSVGEKVSGMQIRGTPLFSFLISYSDQTHHDGNANALQDLQTIPTGKQTERIVMRWVVKHDIDGHENELSITLRISNPINPLLYIQAALSKSTQELDNLEFELGSTCVTVDGAGQAYADEIFLRVSKWLEARNKIHSIVDPGRIYARFEWLIDQLQVTLVPLTAVLALSIYLSRNANPSRLMICVPALVAAFLILRGGGKRVNEKMAAWAQRSRLFSIFSITNGDRDAIAKMAAAAMNSTWKLIGSVVASLLLNVIAGLVSWWLVEGHGL